MQSLKGRNDLFSHTSQEQIAPIALRVNAQSTPKAYSVKKDRKKNQSKKMAGMAITQDQVTYFVLSVVLHL